MSSGRDLVGERGAKRVDTSASARRREKKVNSLRQQFFIFFSPRQRQRRSVSLRNKIERACSLPRSLARKAKAAMLPPTAARSAPSSTLRGPHALARASFTSRALHPRQPHRRSSPFPPKFANAPLRRSTATRTQTTRASSALSLEDGDEKDAQVVAQPEPAVETELLPPPPPRLALPLAWSALEAALWPELVITWFSAKKREVTA